MSLSGAPNPTLIYHITNFENLGGILEAVGLYATNSLASEGVVSVAYGHIQERRSKKLVPVGLGGVLHDYVPFYFCPRSPMLYAIHNPSGQMAYRGGQKPMLHLVSSAQQVAGADLNWVFSDRHAVLDYAAFFSDLGSLETSLDWGHIRERYWGFANAPSDCKERKQAEFLAHGFMPWSLILNIGVYDSSVEAQVLNVFADLGMTAPPVTVRRDWYY